MNEIQRVFERYAHLDDALSDSDWCQEGWRSAAAYDAAYDLWVAIKAEHERQQAEAAKPTDEGRLLTHDEMVGLIWGRGSLLEGEQGRPPNQKERFTWIAEAQDAKTARLAREATLREVGEWLGAIAGDISHSAVVGPQEIDMLKSGHMPGESDG